MGKDLPSASEAELDVLKILWEKGPCTVREVAAALQGRKKNRAYTTVLTFLQRLSDKGYVATDRTGSAHRYSPEISRAELIRHRLCVLAREVCDDASEPVLRALKQTSGFSKQELASLRRMLTAGELAANKKRANKTKKRKTG